MHYFGLIHSKALSKGYNVKGRASILVAYPQSNRLRHYQDRLGSRPKIRINVENNQVTVIDSSSKDEAEDHGRNIESARENP